MDRSAGPFVTALLDAAKSAGEQPGINHWVWQDINGDWDWTDNYHEYLKIPVGRPYLKIVELEQR